MTDFENKTPNRRRVFNVMRTVSILLNCIMVYVSSSILLTVLPHTFSPVFEWTPSFTFYVIMHTGFTLVLSIAVALLLLERRMFLPFTVIGTISWGYFNFGLVAQSQDESLYWIVSGIQASVVCISVVFAFFLMKYMKRKATNNTEQKIA